MSPEEQPRSPPQAYRQSAAGRQEQPADVAQAQVWASVHACLASPQSHTRTFYEVCKELTETHAERDDLAERLSATERKLAAAEAETRKRDQKLRQVTAELRGQNELLAQSQTALEDSARRLAQAQSEKNRAQQQARQLKTQLGAAQAKAGTAKRAHRAREAEGTQSVEAEHLSLNGMARRRTVPDEPSSQAPGADSAPFADESTTCSSPRSNGTQAGVGQVSAAVTRSAATQEHEKHMRVDGRLDVVVSTSHWVFPDGLDAASPERDSMSE